MQSGSSKTLEKLPHDYEEKETVQQATCFLPKITKLVCKNCSDESTKEYGKLEHDWSDYHAIANGKHVKECSLCHTQNTGNHDVRTREIPASTCGEYTIKQEYCAVCDYVREISKTVQQHDYRSSVDESTIACGVTYEATLTCSHCGDSKTEQLTKEHSYSWTGSGEDIPATCVQYGAYFEVCTNCNDKRKVVDEKAGYGDHNLKREKERPATETDVGIAYDCYRCEICGHYLQDNADKKCTDYIDNEVVIPKIETVEVQTIAQLRTLAEEYNSTTPTANFYKISAFVLEVAGNLVTLVDVDENGDLTDAYEWLVQLPQNVTGISERDVVTLRGHLVKDADNSLLTGIEVLSADDGDAETCSLFIRSNIDNSAAVYVQYGDSTYYTNNTSNFNCLLKGDVVTFNFAKIFDENNKVLKSVVINNKSYVVTNGVLADVPVDGDVFAEFIYGKNNTNSVVVEKVNTSVWAGDPYAVDAYVYCQYSGATNENGVLNKDSQTKFTTQNSYITSVVIEFESDNADEVGGNEIFAGTDKQHKQNRTYTISNRNKATIDFDETEQIAYFEYFASSKQARVVSITVYYNTNNTLPSTD